MSQFVSPDDMIDGLQENLNEIRRTMAEIEGERIALIDAWRTQMEKRGTDRLTAALIVQEVIDNAQPFERWLP
jgi:hypothetical protein